MAKVLRVAGFAEVFSITRKGLRKCQEASFVAGAANDSSVSRDLNAHQIAASIQQVAHGYGACVHDVPTQAMRRYRVTLASGTVLVGTDRGRLPVRG